MLTFTDTNGFYSDLVVFLVSMIGVGRVLQVESGQKALHPFAPNEDVRLHGRKNGIQVQLGFRPYELMKALLQNETPERILFDEFAHDADPTGFSSKFRAGTKLGITNALIQPCFLNFFERLKPRIRQEHGTDAYEWPAVWNFGRVIRNTFGHNGKIFFQNDAAAPVSWRHYTYSPADNGRLILFNDVGVVELIYLMADMDAATPGIG